MTLSPRALLQPRHEYRLIGLMLVLLHAAVWLQFAGALSRSLMLAHLGLFLVWQPFFSREQRLEWRSAVVFISIAVVFIAWLSWWLLVFWILLLAGLVGGRVLTTRRDRYVYMLVLVFLVSELLIGAIPQMFSIQFRTPEIRHAFAQGLLVIPLVLLFVPAVGRSGKQPYAIDFLYGLTVSLLIGVLALGGLLSMYATGADYPVALLQTVLGLALFLLTISWMWMPLAGFSGLGQLWERYLLNIGTPFEQWLGELARLAEERQQPRAFLLGAMHQLHELPWVAGVAWTMPSDGGSLGKLDGHVLSVTLGDLVVVLHTQRPVGTALMLHARLLVKLVAHFYNEKQREQELTQRAHLQAIYETGARVTHDIKNLLQSMHTMSSAIEQAEGERRREALLLMQRQLPHLTSRLQMALEKLQTPQPASTEQAQARDWWAALKARNAAFEVDFSEQLERDCPIPLECFDSVATNLIENALAKRLAAPDITISVHFRNTADGLVLSVCDSGSAVPDDIADELFHGPVHSRNGLGVGLYQAARLAASLGYRLRLAHNEPGRVCFELCREATAEGVATVTP